MRWLRLHPNQKLCTPDAPSLTTPYSPAMPTTSSNEVFDEADGGRTAVHDGKLEAEGREVFEAERGETAVVPVRAAPFIEVVKGVVLDAVGLEPAAGGVGRDRRAAGDQRDRIAGGAPAVE